MSELYPTSRICRLLRFPISSGRDVRKLLSKFNSSNATMLSIVNGRVVSWLPAILSICNQIRFSTIAGKTVN